MSQELPRPTVDELFETIKRTHIPTVLVEGSDDIIFYRKIEEELKNFGIDMLPAGNKAAVLSLYERIKNNNIDSAIFFIVDNDLWIHSPPINPDAYKEVIRTSGYSIENDLYSDGELENLLDETEKSKFNLELQKFARWYALSVNRNLNGTNSGFRTHPNKILDDHDHFEKETKLTFNENYPSALYEEIINNYQSILRGKSLFALILRQLSSKNRRTKFSSKQLMEFGASRKGPNYKKIRDSVQKALELRLGAR